MEASKRTLALITFGVLAVTAAACKPPVVEPPRSTKTLTVLARLSYVGDPIKGPEVMYGAGSVTGPGLDCHTPPGDPFDDAGNTATCTAEIATGARTTLKAAPDDSTSLLEGWEGDCAERGASPDCTVHMNRDRTVGASFAPVVLLVQAVCRGDYDACATGSVRATDSTGGDSTYTFAEPFGIGCSGCYHTRLPFGDARDRDRDAAGRNRGVVLEQRLRGDGRVDLYRHRRPVREHVHLRRRARGLTLVHAQASSAGENRFR